MFRFRSESTAEAFVNVYKRGGVLAFWQGLSPKMLESASKGAILLFAKEGILSGMESVGCWASVSGAVAGAGAGVCQTVVMGPCTFLVTAAVTGSDSSKSISSTAKQVWAANGFRGFYPGGSAIAFRQATNWASRQGFTEGTRGLMKRYKNSDKLSVAEEASAGIVGGALSTWNQPFEVARIYMQSAANEGGQKKTLVQVFSHIVKTDGPQGLFKGIIPRMGLGIWQTLFMVTGAKLVREFLPW
eukprot:GHVQ01006515.1.p1 GENE.GHVQ01006515.1~~GHVQ01006515.1.p1  ORF type:complete len:244 (-),score=35.35 GHVQ01006515.1:377-1108(-)